MRRRRVAAAAGGAAAAAPAVRQAAGELRRKGRLLEDVRGEFMVAAARYPHAGWTCARPGRASRSWMPRPTRRSGSARSAAAGALAECHPGAVYLHRARQYVVERLDLERRSICARPSRDPWFTRVVTEKDTEILEVLRSKPVGNFIARFGRLKVTERITAYQKRGISGQELISTHPLELPPSVFETPGSGSRSRPGWSRW